MSLSEPQEEWNALYKTRLPSLAKAKDPSQPKWPVVLDHCFARIILDNVIGKDKPWNQVIKSPAYKNMSEDQLREAIELGEKIAKGEAGLVELDERSLEVRGKASKVTGKKGGGSLTGEANAEVTKGENTQAKGKKRKEVEDHEPPGNNDAEKSPKKPKKDDKKVSSYFLPSPKSEAEPTPPTDSKHSQQQPSSSERRNPITNATYPDGAPLDLIKHSNLTPFRKQILTLLCQVPPGKYTTYQAMSDHISATSHKTCARAVGNAMRNNPFAPVVPCHRVLATGGKIGGFGGEWGEGGKHAKTKREMLRAEGVRFDGGGKVVGEVWREFK
ncbi:6-O-methylguanine DNA methyltransferase [Elsinoe ampelina]|uniref:Methylated-DNA--protein-cysteine methyltransferase n=1 Tax=Elsinoe ampelina TaxID=302913 RepID=A0A6A6G1Z6_9PEZI|nr:6-O-methylguanine DNA methyltransferase [Elsinoe ampelina]